MESHHDEGGGGGGGGATKIRVEDQGVEKVEDGGGRQLQQQQQQCHNHNNKRGGGGGGGNGGIRRIPMVFAAVAIATLLLYHSAQNLQRFPYSFYNLLYTSPKHVELKKVLGKAAMKEKTVIITTLNEAWAAPNSIFGLFLESFRIGNETEWLLNHLVVVALDKKAYSICLKMHSHCYALKTSDGFDFSGEAYFMAPDYLKMMWRRIDFLRSVLDLGYSFIFTDVDIMWFRNPFKHLFSGQTDFQIACDYYGGIPNDLNNLPNGGFVYVRSNKKTQKFYEFWYKSREIYPGKHDQDVLNRIKYDPFIHKIGLKIKFLDTCYFGGFCQPSKDLNKVCTMHANCCAGLDNKVHDLKIMLHDWRNYTSLPPNATNVKSWSVPQFCGPASFRRRRDSPKKNLQGTERRKGS